MRSVIDIVVEGGGLRVAWNDGNTDQFSFNFVNNRFRLLRNGNPCPNAAIAELIDSIDYCGAGTTLYAHLFGTSSDHISSSAIGQIGTLLSANTWTTIIWDLVRLESHNGLDLDKTTGIISLPFGEWDIDARAIFHDNTGAATSELMIQIYDVDDLSEINTSFVADTVASKSNGPKSIQTSTQIDLTNLLSEQIKRYMIRTRTNASTTVFGVHPSSLPTGSINNAGLLRITRVG